MARVHLVLFYYERKKLVWNALQSFLDSKYTDWFLTVIDDSEVNKLGPVLEGYEGRNYRVVDTQDTVLSKKRRGGSLFGKFANEAIRAGHGDIVVPVCDDDALCRDSLGPLVNFFDENPQVYSAWCKNIPYNPQTEPLPKHQTALLTDLNRFAGLPGIEASCRVDSSQVVFRAKCFNNPNVGYPFPATTDLDAYLFWHLNKFFGLTFEAPVTLQYKGLFPNQLGGRRDSVPYTSEASHLE